MYAQRFRKEFDYEMYEGRTTVTGGLSFLSQYQHTVSQPMNSLLLVYYRFVVDGHIFLLTELINITIILELIIVNVM